MTTKEELDIQINIINNQIRDARDHKRHDEINLLVEKRKELENEVFFIENEASDLEKNFVKVFAEVQSKIDEQLAIANEALNKAEKISNEYGIPFKSGIVRNGDTYIPRGLSKKLDLVDKDFIRNYFEFEEISTGEYGGSVFSGYGWTKSYC